jgi:hypothetical protein
VKLGGKAAAAAASRWACSAASARWDSAPGGERRWPSPSMTGMRPVASKEPVAGLSSKPTGFTICVEKSNCMGPVPVSSPSPCSALKSKLENSVP